MEGKTAFITGGSSGIGLAIAQELAKKKCRIAIFARDASRLAAAKAAIVHQHPESQIKVISADARHYPSLESGFEQAIDGLGTPHILINCVGRALPGHFEDISPEQMQETMEANFTSTWNACHLGVKCMKENGGRIINTSSIGGFVGVFGYTDYSASKFAIIGFSEALQQEVHKYGIKVQVLCPPDTLTPGYEAENLTKPEETKRISGNAKLMTSAQVAKQAVAAMNKKQFFIIPGFDGKMTHFMKRHFPEIVQYIMMRSIKK
ncbi:MAG: SDR family oxidoreductase [Chitinophagales bacterium]|nr:SDR family oxidoreductase [Chitinophagales bacterium]